MLWSRPHGGGSLCGSVKMSEKEARSSSSKLALVVVACGPIAAGPAMPCQQTKRSCHWNAIKLVLKS